jgi:outer membrane receptor protein involved in Fe transport
LITVLGVRADYHNLFGMQVSPRLHLKYALTEKTDLRFTTGKGWRVPNYIIDNVSLLASSKNWISPDTIRPEISWNTGGSLVQEFKLFGRKADFVTDIYYTFFENQLVVDRDLNINAVAFKNLKNKSFSTSFQAELSFSIVKNLDVRLAYRYIDVRAEFGGKMQQQVMIPPQRGFFNIGYSTRNKRWEYNATLSVFGPSRLPDTGSNEREFSTTYPILNAQITHVVKRWDFYIGGENITNFKQKNAIIAAESPFSAAFDATQIWGPVMGISVYAGCRYVIKRKK